MSVGRLGFAVSIVANDDVPVYYLTQLWPGQKTDHDSTIFNIPEGASLTRVANELAAKGLNRQSLFRLYAQLSRSDRRLLGRIRSEAQSGPELLALFSAAGCSSMRFVCPRARTCGG